MVGQLGWTAGTTHQHQGRSVAEVSTTAATRRWRLLPGSQGLVVVAAAIAAARLGLKPIGDNSTLVHLRTGLELLRTAHVPHADPYSYTAAGHPWVVQSWLASLLYGLADRGGHHLLVLEQGAIMATVGSVIALTARSSTAWRSGVAALLAVAASAPGWSPRPLMFGMLCLGLTVLVVERRASPAWMVPVVWLWVNTHGSFPLGLAWLAARALGEAIDARGWPRVTLPRLGGFLAGLAVALVNPVGARLLTFPLVALHKRATFQGIVEWHSPNFQDPNSLIALIFITGSLVVLLRAALAWAQLLPVCGFLVLALIAARNLGPLGVILGPALGFALSAVPPLAGRHAASLRASPGASPRGVAPGAVAPSPRWQESTATAMPAPAQETSAAPGGPTVPVGARRASLAERWAGTVRWAGDFGAHPVWRGSALGVAAVVIGGLCAFSVRGPTIDVSGYPAKAVDHLAATGRLGPGHHIAAVDVVGCFLIWRVGPGTKVFIDDRYDMYPRAVIDDASTLGAARDGVRGVLDRRRVDTVVWAVRQALPEQLRALGGWHEDFDDGRWVVLERDASNPVVG